MRCLFLNLLLFVTFIGAPSLAHTEEYSVDQLKVLADGDNADARYKLGIHYMSGEGVEKETTKGINLFMHAASQGHAKSQHLLGKLFRDGLYLKRSEKDAIIWFSKAAQQGHGNAQYDLAVMFARYRNSIESIMKSYAWFSVVAQRGHPKAAAGRNEIVKGLDKYQIIEAKRMAREYYKDYVTPYEKKRGNDDENSKEQNQE